MAVWSCTFALVTEKPGFFKRLLRKSAPNYYVTVVNTKSPAGWDIFSNRGQVTNDNHIANFESIPQLFAITNYITDKISNIPVKVVSRTGKDKPGSPVYKLIETPNGYQSWGELIKTHFSYYELSGNGFLYGIKPDGFGDMVTQLICLPVEKTEVILLLDKSLPAWMNEVAAYRVNIGGKYYTLDAGMVLHERYVSLQYNDGSWVYGMSKYVPGDKINKELKAIHNAKTSIIEQRGALGFITNESEMPDEVQTKLVKEKLFGSYGLGADQDKVIVTTEKLKWQQMALGIQELQLIENAKYSFATLCQINGFDPVIFSTEGSTFANKETAERDLTRKVLKPKVDNFYKALSVFLGEWYGGDQIVADWSKVEELQDDREKLTNMLIKQIDYSIITPYEASEMIYGEPDAENPPPDEYFLKSGLKPLLAPEPTNPIDPATGLPSADVFTPDMIQSMIDNNQQNGN